MAVNVLKSYLKDWESVLLKIRLYVFCPELLVNSVYISSRFYYLLRMFQLHSSLIYIYIYIYIYISILAIFHPHPYTRNILTSHSAFYMCLSVFSM